MDKNYNNLEKEFKSFLYIISHDFNTLTRHIQGFTQLLMKKLEPKLEEDEKKYAEIIQDSTKRLERMLEGILQISRVNTDTHPLETINFDHLIEDVKIKLSDEIQGSKAQITLSKLPTLQAKKNQLHDLFYHLLDNAIKFRQQDRIPEIFISASQKGSFWEFSIEDNGIGIKEGGEDDIFQLFKRLHFKEEYPGVGAGLAICKKIVESHGGEISFSKPNHEGAKFEFTLPENL